MTSIQITLKSASGKHESLDLTFPDSAVDEASVKVEKEAFAFGVTYVCHRAKADARGQSDSVLCYEADVPDGAQLTQQEATLKRIDTISDEFAKRIEGDRQLNESMDEVVGRCTSTVQDASVIKSHLNKVHTHLFANQDGNRGFSEQLVCFVGFLEYGYQLIKKYITKMCSEGKVGVFMASVIWAIVSFLWSSGVLTAQLKKLLSKQSSTDRTSIVLGCTIVMSGMVGVAGLAYRHKAITAAAAVTLLGLGIAYWYMRKK